MTGAKAYREKFKPPTIQYIEDHMSEFFEFMTNMTENYVSYTTHVTEKVATYLEQTVPLAMNRVQTLTTVAADREFIAPDDAINGVIPGLIDAEFANLAKAFLLVIGRAVNTFAGQNYLDCSVANNNHWYTYMGGPGGTLWHLLSNNNKLDGVMNDRDWLCEAQGVIHPFTLMYDLSSPMQLNALSNLVGVILARGRSIQDSLIVTVDLYLKLVWKL